LDTSFLICDHLCEGNHQYSSRYFLGDIWSCPLALIVETSFTKLYEGQPLFDDIYKTLKESGFDYGGNWDQLTDSCDGRILQADAIFLRC